MNIIKNISKYYIPKENESLKILLGEKELEGKLKAEMLKNKYPELRKKL